MSSVRAGSLILLALAFAGGAYAQLVDAPHAIRRSRVAASPDPAFVDRSRWQGSQEQRRGQRFDWGSAFRQSGMLLGIQHSLRMAQEKTREQLDGKWWHDYLYSVEGLHGWNDGNPVITNYVGHPIMGAVTGYIQIHNDPRGRDLTWAPDDPQYWKSRMKAFGWAAVYSTQYELGPLGEAMIGNVGYDRGTMAYVDLVITPVGGLGMILLEDWLDQRVLERIVEQRTTSERKARFLRVIINPQRSLANLLRFKRPSYRDTRELIIASPAPASPRTPH